VEAPTQDVDQVCRLCNTIAAEVGREMLGPDVPVRVDVTSGRNWWQCCQASPWKDLDAVLEEESEEAE